MITVLHNSSVSRGSISKYSLTRGQQDPETGLYQYTLALDNIIAADSVVEVIYCHCGSTEDGNAAIGQAVSETTPASLALQNTVERENLESLRQRLLPMKSECRTPITITHEECPCLYGSVGQYSDPQGEDFNQPFAIINLRHGTAADEFGNITTTLAIASTNLYNLISAIQTAEGATWQIFETAARIHELIIHLSSDASNGYYTYADADSLVSEIETLTTEMADACDNITYNDIPLLTRDHDIIVPILYGTQPVETDLLCLPATWGAANSELRTIWAPMAESLRQTIDNNSATPTDIYQIIEEQHLPAINELLRLLESQRAHIGSLNNVCEYLASLCDLMNEFYQYQAPTYDREHYWAARRETMESVARDITRRQHDLLIYSCQDAATDQEKAQVVAENNHLTSLLHLIINWHQQFGLTDQDFTTR